MTANPCGKILKGTELSKQREVFRAISAELNRRRTDYARGIAFVGGAVGGCTWHVISLCVRTPRRAVVLVSDGFAFAVASNNPITDKTLKIYASNPGAASMRNGNRLHPEKTFPGSFNFCANALCIKLAEDVACGGNLHFASP